MAICRIFQNLDGSVSIMRLNPRLQDVTFEGETAKNDSLKGLPFFDVDESELPTDRSERDKWRIQDGKIKIEGKNG